MQQATTSLVRLDRISKDYRLGRTTVHALQDITLEIQAGDFCAFVGPSGCGKSTLLNLIGGLDHPTSGEMMIEERAVTRESAAEWTRLRREVIGIVFQSFHLIPGLTVVENVALPLLLKGERGAAVHNRVTEVLAAVDMAARSTHRPGELSGGEQQRVAIARAIVHRPRLILADEPTGNLDSRQGAEIVDLFRSLPRRFGHTVVLVTHSEPAAQAADYLWEMRDGRLVGRTAGMGAKGSANESLHNDCGR
ncbi:MAG: ABC transporter ATP-binding protein [Nitrospiraceae bacterium]|nr:ABC transporter ATP-binding protein [Nitrospiraceae bacterium]